jgi:uncharacterized repeat protein (TIGR02543 family)
MKRVAQVLLLFIVVGVIVLMLAGCNERINDSPVDIIQDTYGNKQYKISFSAESLVVPLDDVTYSATQIPQMPTPTKIGYFFQGWYYDQDFLEPYSSDTLYLKMKDLVLYPKWGKEEFIHNGIYDVTLSGRILEDTVIKNELSDDYGGYKDFADHIIYDNSYIEKTDEGIFLKLQYDNEALTGFFDGLAPFNLSLNATKNSSNIYIKNSINDLSNSVKTVFIDLAEGNLEKPLYIDVKFVNYYNKFLPKGDRHKTITNYCFELSFKEFLGFKQPFIKTQNELEDGYYLVKTFVKQLDFEPTMMSSFNSVYSYIVAENGNYKLIKEINPYFGLVGASSDLKKDLAFYYETRATTFSQFFSCYDIHLSDRFIPSSIQPGEYVPSKYNAGDYKRISVEFSKEKNKYYQVIDLGESLHNQYVMTGAVTGFMEVASAMGGTSFIMDIDYASMLKVAEVPYVPSVERAYTFSDKILYYHGSKEDLMSGDLYLNLIKENGSNIELINYFYSRNVTSKSLFNHKIEIIPEYNNKPLSERRYETQTFTFNYYVFGFENDENIFYDSMSLSDFGSYGLRENEKRHLNGVSFNIGDFVNVKTLFEKKVNSIIDFSQVDYKIYKLNNGVIDKGSVLNLGSRFEFTEPVAIMYEYKNNNHYGVVYCDKYVEPIINLFNVDGTPFDFDYEYKVGEICNYPNLKYEWMGKNCETSGDWYGESEGVFKNPLMVNYYYRRQYALSLMQGTGDYRSKGFEVKDAETYIYFDLRNKYNETKPYVLKLKVEDSDSKFYIQDGSNVILTGKQTFAQKDGVLVRKKIKADFGVLDTNKEYLEAFKDKKYYLKIDDVLSELEPTRFGVFIKGKVALEREITHDESLADIVVEIKNEADNNGAIVLFEFDNDVITFKLSIAINATMSGRSIAKLMHFQSYFTDTKYAIQSPQLVGINNEVVGGFSVSIFIVTQTGELIQGSGNGTFLEIVQSGSYMTVKFLEPGEYKIRYSLYNSLGVITLYESVNVLDKRSADIFITYKTQENHKFKDGSLEKAVRYNLSEQIQMPKDDWFESSNGVLQGFIGYSNRLIKGYIFSTDDLIRYYNSNEVTFTTY